MVMKTKKLLVLFLILLLSFTSGACNARDSGAFSVNGLWVEKDELVYYMRENTFKAAYELETEYGLDSAADDFWTQVYPSVTPFDYLKEYSVKEIVRIKAQQLWAKQNGILTPLYYSEQVKANKTENAKRKKAEANGEIVYGTTERIFSIYFTDLYLGMKASMREKLQLTDEQYEKTVDGLVKDAEIVYKDTRITVKEIF